jgi:hypothetical protein
VRSHPLLTLLIPTVVAIVSWFVGSWLSVRRDRANKRRDLRVQYLIEAYRRLVTASNRNPSQSQFEDLESAVDDIQLFGTPKQVAAAQEFARRMAEDREAPLDMLLADLRADLRKELKLDPIEGDRVFLRFGKNDVQSGGGAKAM